MDHVFIYDPYAGYSGQDSVVIEITDNQTQTTLSSIINITVYAADPVETGDNTLEFVVYLPGIEYSEIQGTEIETELIELFQDLVCYYKYTVILLSRPYQLILLF